MGQLSLTKKHLKQIVTFIFIFGLIHTVNPAHAKKKTLQSISGSELNRLIESDKAPMIIDVRSAREYKSGHVQGSINIPFRNNFAKLDKVMADPERLIVVYCAYGPRAAWAQKNMRKAGLKNVILMTGHISKWKKQKLPLEK